MHSTFEPLIKSGTENDFFLVSKIYYNDKNVKDDYSEIKQFQFDNKEHKLIELDNENDRLTEAINLYLIRQGLKTLNEL